MITTDAWMERDISKATPNFCSKSPSPGPCWSPCCTLADRCFIRYLAESIAVRPKWQFLIVVNNGMLVNTKVTSGYNGYCKEPGDVDNG